MSALDTYAWILIVAWAFAVLSMIDQTGAIDWLAERIEQWHTRFNAEK